MSSDVAAANKAAGKDATPPAGQDQSVQASYPDWTAAFQAYYGQAAQPPPGYYPATSAPQAHPYMWGQMMPYGQASPYGAPMYPPVYGTHPGAQPYMGYGMPAAMPGNMEPAQDGQKDVSAVAGAGASAAGAPVAPPSAAAGAKAETPAAGPHDGAGKFPSSAGVFSPSGGEDEDDEDDDHDDEPQRLAGGEVPGLAMGVGVDYSHWAQQQAGKKTGAAANGASLAPAGTDMWLHQDDREAKRQRRKQSNRESARRSRLRKQAECEELASRVQSLAEDNLKLRSEMQQLQDECGKAAAHSTVLQERLKGAGVPPSEVPPLPTYTPQMPPLSDLPPPVTLSVAGDSSVGGSAGTAPQPSVGAGLQGQANGHPAVSGGPTEAAALLAVGMGGETSGTPSILAPSNGNAMAQSFHAVADGAWGNAGASA